ncbi:hypothetical protein BD779DRAFT_1582028, partial [Infundibulicybe gibba]
KDWINSTGKVSRDLFEACEAYTWEQALVKKYVLGRVTKEARIQHINAYILPIQDELGYCAARLPTGEMIRFFRKLDAAFTALERYHITHALQILVNKADILMHEFSCLPKTAFLHNPVYKFHTRAARLLERWQPMIREYEAQDRWTCECEPRDRWNCVHYFMMDPHKLVHRRAVDT